MNEKIEVEEAVRNNSFLRNNKTLFVFCFFCISYFSLSTLFRLLSFSPFFVFVR